MQGNDWAFNSGPRRSQDGGWFIAYVVFMLCSAGAGVFAWKNMCVTLYIHYLLEL